MGSTTDEHVPHNEHQGADAGGAKEQSHRPHDYADSSRQEHNDRVLEDVRKQLREETTTIHPNGKGYTQTLRIHMGQGNPNDPDVAAMLHIDSLPKKERRRALDEYHTSKLLGGLSVAEYLARNPNVDPDLFTADGRYLPYCRFGEAKYTLKKLGKLLQEVVVDLLLPTKDKKK